MGFVIKDMSLQLNGTWVNAAEGWPGVMLLLKSPIILGWAVRQSVWSLVGSSWKPQWLSQKIPTAPLFGKLEHGDIEHCQWRSCRMGNFCAVPAAASLDSPATNSGMPAEHRGTAEVPGLCHAWLWFSQETPERIQLGWAGLGASPVLGKENWGVSLSALTPSFLLLYCILYLRRGVQWEKAFLVPKFSGSLLALPPSIDFCIFQHIQVLWWFQQHQTGEGNSKRHHHKMSLLSHLHLSFLCLSFCPFQFKAEKRYFSGFVSASNFLSGFFSQCQVFLSKFFCQCLNFKIWSATTGKCLLLPTELLKSTMPKISHLLPL